MLKARSFVIFLESVLRWLLLYVVKWDAWLLKRQEKRLKRQLFDILAKGNIK